MLESSGYTGVNTALNST